MKVGKIPESVLKRSVLKQIKTKRNEVINGAGVGEDCAIFAPSGREYTVSCMGGTAVFRENDLKKAIIKCTNNLAASGAEPFALMLTLLLSGDMEEGNIRRLMSAAEEICKKLNIQIAGGHTAVVSGREVTHAVTVGLGKLEAAVAKAGNKAGPGQDIVISKWIGLEGTAALAEAFNADLKGQYPEYLVDEAAGFNRFLSVIPEAATAVKSGVRAMHDASEGGIFAALWELGERSGIGLTIDLMKLPIRQETVEVCEYLNVNPYELLSGGCLVMAAEDGPKLVGALAAENIPAVVAGKITASNDKVVINGDEVRFLERPRTDEIYRMLPDRIIHKSDEAARDI